jgi:hypothetical protein
MIWVQFILTVIGNIIATTVTVVFIHMGIKRISMAQRLKDYGIVKINVTNILIAEEEFLKMIEHASRIRICMVSGIGFFNTFENAIKAYKGKMEILLCDPDSQMAEHIYEAECKHGNGKKPAPDIRYEVNSINKMFKGFDNISIRHTDSGYRFPYIMTEYDNKQNEARFAFTLPPAKAHNNSISFRVLDYGDGKGTQSDNEKKTLMYNMLKRNFETVWSISKNEKVLIVVASQHPLVDGVYPNKDFAARLDKSIEIYNKIDNEGRYIVKICVLGSRHRIKDGNGNYINDKISLAQAGFNYLKSNNIKKINKSDIYAVRKNKKYAPDGVYSTIEECKVVSEIFKHEGFKKLICIASKEQIGRIEGAYKYFGLVKNIEFIGLDEIDGFHKSVDSEAKRLAFLDNPEKVLRETYTNARLERSPDDGNIWGD